MVGTFHLFDATDGGARGEGASTPGSAFRKTRSRSLFRRMPSFFGGSNGKRVDGYLCDSLASIGGGEDDAMEAFSRVDVRSSIARGRWRLLRERWMEQRYPIVKSHQTMKRLSLMRADDVDDRIVVLLRVNVLGARGLPAADSDGKSDPYCVVQPAPGVSARTRPVMNTLDPLWHRAFTFTAPCGLRRSGNSVVLSVIDYDGYDEADEDGDDPLGFAAIAHHDVQYVGPGMIPPGPVWIDLMPARKDAEARGRFDHSRAGQRHRSVAPRHRPCPCACAADGRRRPRSLRVQRKPRPAQLGLAASRGGRAEGYRHHGRPLRRRHRDGDPQARLAA